MLEWNFLCRNVSNVAESIQWADFVGKKLLQEGQTRQRRLKKRWRHPRWPSTSTDQYVKEIKNLILKDRRLTITIMVFVTITIMHRVLQRFDYSRLFGQKFKSHVSTTTVFPWFRLLALNKPKDHSGDIVLTRLRRLRWIVASTEGHFGKELFCFDGQNVWISVLCRVGTTLKARKKVKRTSKVVFLDYSITLYSCYDPTERNPTALVRHLSSSS